MDDNARGVERSVAVPQKLRDAPQDTTPKKATPSKAPRPIASPRLGARFGPPPEQPPPKAAPPPAPPPKAALPPTATLRKLAAMPARDKFTIFKMHTEGNANAVIVQTTGISSDTVRNFINRTKSSRLTTLESLREDAGASDAEPYQAAARSDECSNEPTSDALSPTWWKQAQQGFQTPQPTKQPQRRKPAATLPNLAANKPSKKKAMYRINSMGGPK